MSAVRTPALDHVVLQNIRWQTFEALLEDLGDHRGRIAYDGGTLEITSPSPKHEALKSLLGRFIETFTEELNIKIASRGFTTLKSVLKAKGVEPDECYYIQNEAAVRNRDEIDLARDPPPDLAVEIDITSTFLNRRSIYAALGIPEVWSHDGKELRVLRLKDGKYEASGESGTFPMLPMAELAEFLKRRHALDETALVRSFRAWVRERFGTR